MQPAIEVKNLSVDFKVRTFNSSTFKEWVMNALQRRNDIQNISALKSVDLTIYPGESVAFIGHNGSGKSTLLKVIAGVIDTDSHVAVRGRIGPMIELGTGFDVELNGFENIRLACTLMGIAKEEIESKIDSIVAFSELEDFMHIPFKNYSSGMQARLGFACTTAIEPDILLVDEVMAVGDSNFSRKCLDRINQLQSRGCTIVMVSHDENTIRKFCDRAIVLEEGSLKYDGMVSNAFEVYHRIMDLRYKGVDGVESDLLRKRNLARNDAQEGAELLRPTVSAKMTASQSGMKVYEIDMAQPFTLHFDIEVDQPDRMQGNVVFGVALLKGDVRVCGANSSMAGLEISHNALRGVNSYSVDFLFEKGLPDLMAGTYDIAFAIHDKNLERTIFIDKIKQIAAVNSIYGYNSDDDLMYFAPENIRVEPSFSL